MTRIAFIQSSWHAELVGRCRTGFLARMKELGWSEDRIDIFSVPGALEIPLHAQRLARRGKYAGIVCAGLVVDGGVYRHEFVADAVISGLMRVQLDTDVPDFSAVLTPHHFHDSETHHRFFHDHLLLKGEEVADACVATLKSLEALPA